MLDTETTGLDPARHELREVAVVVLDAGLHEIRRIEWRRSGGGTLEDLVERVAPELPDSIVVAHNARFDLAFLEADPRTSGSRLAAPTRWLCTASLGRRRALDVLARRFDVVAHGRHTAMGDAETLARTLARMVVAAEARGLDTVAGIVLVAGGGGTAPRQLHEAGWTAVVAGLDRVVPTAFAGASQRGLVRRLLGEYGERGPPTPLAISSVVDEMRGLDITALVAEALLGEGAQPCVADSSDHESHT
ncbi:MAG: 3'-5' exonuclease [Solirubrobacteraceae bacterium]|nr:3'-5' exonuclease [Solirubrobacteraceae bacterium]